MFVFMKDLFCKIFNNLSFEGIKREILNRMCNLFQVEFLFALLITVKDLKLKRKWHKSQRAVVGAQRSTSFFFQY